MNFGENMALASSKLGIVLLVAGLLLVAPRVGLEALREAFPRVTRSKAPLFQTRSQPSKIMTQRFIVHTPVGTLEKETIEDAITAGIALARENGSKRFKIETRTTEIFELSWWDENKQPQTPVA